MSKTREKSIEDNLWGSPALFTAAAIFCFWVLDGRDSTKIGWILYACGWIPALLMLALCIAKSRKPGVGGVASFSILLIFGLLFLLNHS